MLTLRHDRFAVCLGTRLGGAVSRRILLSRDERGRRRTVTAAVRANSSSDRRGSNCSVLERSYRPVVTVASKHEKFAARTRDFELHETSVDPRCGLLPRH